MFNPTRRQFNIAAATLPIASHAYVTHAAAPNKIKIAQIGVTHAHASGKMQAIRSLPDLYEVVGIADPNPTRAQQAVSRAPYAGLKVLTVEQLLNTPNLQAVAIESDIDKQIEYATLAIQAGMHIHLDKPAGLTLPPFEKLCKLADTKKRTIQMGYMLRYNPAFELLFEVAKHGWLGQIMELDAMMGKRASASLRKQLSQFTGGGMFELACHLIDAAITILGKPTSVTPFTRRTQAPKDSFADNQLAVLQYPHCAAAIRCNHNDPFGFPRRRFQIAGTQGAFEIKPLESGQIELSLDQDRKPYKKGTQHFKLTKKGGRYDGEFFDLAKVIRNEKQLAWDRNHDLAVHETILRASDMPLN